MVVTPVTTNFITTKLDKLQVLLPFVLSTQLQKHLHTRPLPLSLYLHISQVGTKALR